MTTEKESYMMELWVSRAAVETVLRAAAGYKLCCDGNVVAEIDAAIRSILDAVHDAWEDPLNVTPL